MKDKAVISKSIVTEDDETEFQVRLIAHQGVGLLSARNGKSYLVLDSIEYWFDLIQNAYPPKKKCKCKQEWFTVRFDYIPRAGTEDFKEVKIICTCAGCNKTARPVSIEIDYSPTDELLTRPITYCEQPNLKYKFSELLCYWQAQNLTTFLDYMFHTLRVNVYCLFWQRPEFIRRFEKVTFEKAIQIITINHQHFGFYFSAHEIDTEAMVAARDEKGVYLKADIWRRHEIIHLSSPMAVAGYGLLYEIQYCNQYLDKGVVKDKSRSFEELTHTMKRWLGETFVTKGGKNQFDGKEAYDKLMQKARDNTTS